MTYENFDSRGELAFEESWHEVITAVSKCEDNGYQIQLNVLGLFRLSRTVEQSWLQKKSDRSTADQATYMGSIVHRWVY
jgi:hypothetical protein